ncbi:dihydrolipoyllysine-residue succinyltransferase, E2 component of oxoglutarate dehydrogenase complex [Necator americanus]|uniref:Dihydrolipoyllysine-residue succinyltransferase component of 2-oxoglutarate dehydrogenase complex, mitochondrial n=1 Tax=Necator americanus TaxID=51031 RepID=W2SK81_NECAM|nr:dihydrolipoyllysine-residue succinyltransferase, E2 component of oxoglutarate dehydrogenase complex [Necator americanus]ETN69963.1 dihydrolipoyllysine-residue succinyltransferase, E2 component of oxoglutarate dehydrogenase complex [Necator americanus]
MIGRKVPALQRCAVNVARQVSFYISSFFICFFFFLHLSFQRFCSSLSPCRSILTRRSLSASTRVPIAHLSFVPVRAIHASGIRLSDVVIVEGPAFAESISEGDIRWIKKVGDFVNEDELVAEIETDKTSVEVPAPQSGTIVELLVQDGDKVTAKQKLYKLQPGSAGAAPTSAPPKEVPKPQPPKEASKVEPSKEAPKPVAPPTPVAAPAPPPPPSSVQGQIPKTPPPVSRPPPSPISSVPVVNIPVQRVTVPPGTSPDLAITGAREEIRVKMNRMRLRIASRLKDAQNTYAMLTTFNEVDMRDTSGNLLSNDDQSFSNVIEMRAKYQKDFMKKHGIKLGLMSPFVRAAAYALQENPVVNAVIDENEIIYRHFVDMSIAVATPKGLVVPVLRNVETMNYAQIEKELAALGEKARDNKLAVEDMEGGTFTISNGGVFGSVFGTPIINPPQSAILGMHGIFDRPVAVNGKVEIRPIMQVALTYDHRLIDGREAVTFLRKIKSAVEDPRTILMNI